MTRKFLLAVGAEAAEVDAVDFDAVPAAEAAEAAEVPAGAAVTETARLLRVIADAVSSDEDDEDETDTAADDSDPLSQLLDLGKLRTEPPPIRVYLEHKLFVQGHVTKLVAGSDTGKTIFFANLALAWSQGYSALDIEDGAPRKLARPMRVLYVDGEVGPEWWRDYLHRFAAPLELPNLGVVSFPDWAPLTTDTGAAEFWRLFDTYCPDVVILDTLSSFIDGDEESSTTWIAFDNRITLPLKAKGVTAIFADHTGHAGARARGSSAKRSKLDAEWLMESSPPRSNGLKFSILKDRFGALNEELRLRRVDGPLRHVRSGQDQAAQAEPGDLSDKVAAVVAQLDAWNVATTTGLPTVANRLRTNGHRAGDDVIRKAIAHRKNRPGE